MKITSIGLSVVFACVFSTNLSSDALSQTRQLTGGGTLILPNRGRSVDRELGRPASANAGIKSILFAERSDDPCQFDVGFTDINTFDDAGSAEFQECSNRANRREGTLSSYRKLTLPTGALVTGVRICLNSGGTKLKGLQLIGAYAGCLLGENVFITPQACSHLERGSHDYRLCSRNPPNRTLADCTRQLSVHYERTNCRGSNNGPDSDWETTAACPAGQVATTVHLSTRSSSGNRTMVDGVGLLCHTLTSQ